MLVNTKHFGQIDLDETKVIYFENGILGFEGYKKYTVLYDDIENGKSDISWLQSLEDASLALPIISPFMILDHYNPEVEDEYLLPLGDINENNLVVLVTITVPKDAQDISANLKAPIIINSETRKGAQIIAQNSDYEIKYRFYEKLKKGKTEKEGVSC